MKSVNSKIVAYLLSSNKYSTVNVQKAPSIDPPLQQIQLVFSRLNITGHLASLLRNRMSPVGEASPSLRTYPLHPGDWHPHRHTATQACRHAGMWARTRRAHQEDAHNTRALGSVERKPNVRELGLCVCVYVFWRVCGREKKEKTTETV